MHSIYEKTSQIQLEYFNCILNDAVRKNKMALHHKHNTDILIANIIQINNYN